MTAWWPLFIGHWLWNNQAAAGKGTGNISDTGRETAQFVIVPKPSSTPPAAKFLAAGGIMLDHASTGIVVDERDQQIYSGR